MHAVFARAARRIFGNFAISSRKFGAKFAWHRRQTRTFSHLNALPTRSRAAATCFSSRSARWPISGNFSARGAPKFWEICNSFARLLRKICETSARHSGFFACTTHYRLDEELQRCSVVCVTYVGRVHANFARAVRRNSGNFAIFSRDFGATFA